jgi:hypothetical protein
MKTRIAFEITLVAVAGGDAVGRRWTGRTRGAASGQAGSRHADTAAEVLSVHTAVARIPDRDAAVTAWFLTSRTGDAATLTVTCCCSPGDWRTGFTGDAARVWGQVIDARAPAKVEPSWARRRWIARVWGKRRNCRRSIIRGMTCIVRQTLPAVGGADRCVAAVTSHTPSGDWTRLSVNLLHFPRLELAAHSDD